MILTVRRDDMRTHAGQIAFPGGRIDAGEDATPPHCGKRGRSSASTRDLVEPVAAIEPYLTITGYSVTPVIGVDSTRPAARAART